MIPDTDILRLLGEALALGLLVGIERYRDREPGEKKAAGVRTFAIFCLLGALCGILSTTAFTVVTFSAVAVLVLLGYHRSPSDSVGSTTELTAILVFWIGYLLSINEAAAISLGIILTILLVSKQLLHRFVKEQITESEFEATLKFLAVVLVIYPVLPDQSMGPFDFFNPRQVWGLVILVSTISYGGYLLVRLLGKRRGLLLGSLAGGVVSTTAVTMSLAERARNEPGTSRLMGTAAVLGNAMQGPRLLVLLWVVNRGLAQFLMLPLLGMAAVGLTVSWLLMRKTDDTSKVDFSLQNPFSFSAALKFSLFLVAILFLVEMATRQLGNQGTLMASAFAGTGSASAVALSVAGLFQPGGSNPMVAPLSIMIGITTNSLTKWVLARLNGTREMSIWLSGGLIAMLFTAYLALFARF